MNTLKALSIAANGPSILVLKQFADLRTPSDINPWVHHLLRYTENIPLRVRPKFPKPR